MYSTQNNNRNIRNPESNFACVVFTSPRKIWILVARSNPQISKDGGSFMIHPRFNIQEGYNYIILHFLLDLLLLSTSTVRAAFAASSNTRVTPISDFAEHSRYPYAPILFATAFPSSLVIIRLLLTSFFSSSSFSCVDLGLELFKLLSSSPPRKSVLHPTRSIGISASQHLLTSSIQYSSTFFKDGRLLMAKHITTTCEFGYWLASRIRAYSTCPFESHICNSTSTFSSFNWIFSVTYGSKNVAVYS